MQQDDILELQDLPEYGGSAHPELFGLTSWISVEGDCETNLTLPMPY
ncbi:hypothetical protein [Streptacidiphilus cavernicola]|uniref:Lasso RiPP family leader peptide-containing protein n=1 Tax=Streptacidiphilus cavernicola TaxID=3342716 RepID=A0ABV6VZ83_9ACTN